MLSDVPVHTTIPAADLDRACRFYGETLGFSELRRLSGGVMFSGAGGTRFVVYPTPNAGASPNTLMGFAVDDIDKHVEDLRGRGVTFEEYDYPGLKTVNGIADRDDIRSAWFKDTEGNILGIVQLPPQ